MQYNYYIVVLRTTDQRELRSVLSFLKKHGNIHAVAILVSFEDARKIGGLSRKSNIKIIRGYLALPAP